MTEAICDQQTHSIIGQVVSTKMEKTIVVLVERTVPHPKYGKYVKRRTKLFAHDETGQCSQGDIVMIEQCRPYSKNKNWMLIKILEHKAQG